jgi:hypothetical protein
MKKLLILSFLILGFSAYSQADEGRVEGMKRDFLTKELQLTASESDAFFPLYNEYTQKKKEARKSLRAERKSNESSVDKMIDLEQGIVDIQKEYIEKFRKILPEKKIVQLIEAEKKFKVMIMSQLKN